MLGSALLGQVTSSKENTVIGLTRSDLDLRDSAALEKILISEKPDVLIHAAAKVGGIQANIKNPFEFLAANLSMDTNVIQSCISAGVANVLYVGSSCMYPKNHRQPLVETDILAAPLEPTNEGYAIAKIAGSKLCEYASASFGLNYRTIIPSNLYGPGDNFNPESSHLIASVIRKVHDAKLTGAKEIEVWGSGSARREFTYVGDLAAWVASSMSKINELPGLLNVGMGLDYSIDEFYVAAMSALDYQVPLVHNLSKPAGMRARLMDSSTARQHHDWSPTTDLVTGLEKTYKWFLKSQDKDARL
jgi:GDP-L-fucose synthase